MRQTGSEGLGRASRSIMASYPTVVPARTDDVSSRHSVPDVGSRLFLRRSQPFGTETYRFGPTSATLRSFGVPFARACTDPQRWPSVEGSVVTRAQHPRTDPTRQREPRAIVMRGMRDDALASSQLSSAVKVPSSSSWTSWDPHAQEARRSETEKHISEGREQLFPTRREALSGELPPRLLRALKDAGRLGRKLSCQCRTVRPKTSRLFLLEEEDGRSAVIWLILPVVICLSQRLSHACLSLS